MAIHMFALRQAGLSQANTDVLLRSNKGLTKRLGILNTIWHALLNTDFPRGFDLCEWRWQTKHNIASDY